MVCNKRALLINFCKKRGSNSSKMQSFAFSEKMTEIKGRFLILSLTYNSVIIVKIKMLKYALICYFAKVQGQNIVTPLKKHRNYSS